MTEETSILSTAIRTGLLLNAALLMSRDIRWGETATRTASPAGGEGGQNGSVDPGVVRTEKQRERFCSKLWVALKPVFAQEGIRERNKVESSKILLLGDALYLHTCTWCTHLLSRCKGQEGLTKPETDRAHAKFPEELLGF